MTGSFARRCKTNQPVYESISTPDKVLFLHCDFFCSPQTERESNVLNNKVTLQHIHKSDAEEVEVVSKW